MAHEDQTRDIGHHRVAIIGAGFAGIGMAVRLLTEGVHDLVVLERADDLGGTWRDNSYPGCQCDVPSHLYSFSFAPNPDWTRSFAPWDEIHAYLRDCADRFGVTPHIRYGAEVRDARWDDAAQRWALDTAAGPCTADVLIAGTGPLSEPSVPPIPGLESFAGTMFHSARWDHDHDLTGERVAVIGTGASAIQFVPHIQRKAAQLSVFQRTPPWIVPRPDREIPPARRRWFRRFPLLQKAARAAIYWNRELLVVGLAKRPRLMRFPQRLARDHLTKQVPDPQLRAKLTPEEVIGCKRILLSDDYYPALTQPNVAVVTGAIREIRESSVVTIDGQEHPVDAIVLGTGFAVTTHPAFERVHGRDGRSLAEHWAHGGMQAYKGTTIAGFPNLFVLAGPNTGLGHSSIVFMIESQIAYVIDALRTMRRDGLASVDVEPSAMAAFNDRLQRLLARTVWNTGCSSWYLDAAGRNPTMWPGFTWQYRLATRRFDVEAYRCTPNADREPSRAERPALGQPATA